MSQWHIKRTDLGAKDSGAYHPAKTRSNPHPAPVQSVVVVYAETLEDALEQGATMMGVPVGVLTAARIQSGFGWGEMG